MKRIKKFAAALLTAIMMMTMTVTAYAAGGTHTLTVNVNDGQDLNGQTINLYKLFDVTTSPSGGTTNYAYTVNKATGYKDALEEVLNVKGQNLTDAQIAEKVANLGENNNQKVQDFANSFTKKALTASPKLEATKSEGPIKGSESVKSKDITGLETGYYLVYVTGGKEIQSSLVLVDKNQNITLKTEAPSITKTAEQDTVSIGQVVKYTVTGSIPDTTGYDSYVYKIHDELTKGLDFVNDANGAALGTDATAVKVTVEFTEAGVTDASENKPTTATLSGEGSRTMSLDLSEWVRNNQTNKGKQFTVTYYAKVNKDAEVKEQNKAQLEYGNNPNDTTFTTPSIVKTPTYPLDVNKIKTGTTEMLDGATFKLYRNSVETENVVKVSAVAGKDGCYVVDPSSNTTEMVTIKDKIDGKGYNLHLNGLAAGTYYLEETKAPDGFNKLTDPIKIVIEKNGETYTITADGAEGNILTVKNSTGSLLPSTGGTGVIVFAGVAILLVFGVVVSFIRDKRKAC